MLSKSTFKITLKRLLENYFFFAHINKAMHRMDKAKKKSCLFALIRPTVICVPTQKVVFFQKVFFLQIFV